MSTSDSDQTSQTNTKLPGWAQKYTEFGANDPVLQKLIASYDAYPMEVEVQETNIENSSVVFRNTFRDVTSFIDRLDGRPEHDDCDCIRAISVRRLSGDLMRLLGTLFRMDHDLWTSRILACDREYFASPLNEKGATCFSHFHLACVQFFRATDQTPEEFRTSRKINHTTRLLSLMDIRPKEQRVSFEHPKIFVIRRISGHLRRDGKLWTFLYMCDPIDGFDKAHYVSDIPGTALSDITEWMSDCLHEQMSQSYALNICTDGFGLIVKILRDIKSSWKLMLTELETFLEDMNENLDDDEFIAAAGFLHRQYLLSIDYFQRQLFYHERYITYLISQMKIQDPTLVPSVFKPDFLQESDALKVVGLRLNALRMRTTSVLDMILSLNSIKQTAIQTQDAKIAISQGEYIRRLTQVTMAFLPPSFVASVFGMNTVETEGLKIWMFVLVAILFSLVSMSAVLLRLVHHPQRKPATPAVAMQGHEPSKIWGRPNLPVSLRSRPTPHDLEIGA